MKSIFKILALGLASVMTVFAFTACSHRLDSKNASSEAAVTSKYEVDPSKLDKSKSFVIALYPEYAPISCAQFEKLVSEGFYDGLTFHRVYKDFMAQGGNGATQGRTASTIKGEFSANGVENKLGHTRGTVSMARSTAMDSASSQFFIVYSETYKKALDGNYAAFGQVTEGMEIVDSFLEIEMAQGTDKIPTVPTEPITILKAEIDGKDDEGHTLCRFYMQVGNEK